MFDLRRLRFDDAIALRDAGQDRSDAVELPGAMRWVARRVRLVHHVLTIIIGLLPEQLTRCIAEMGAVRTRLQTETALRALRSLVDAHTA